MWWLYSIHIYIYLSNWLERQVVYVYERQIVSHLSCFVFLLYGLYFTRDYCNGFPFRDAWVLAILGLSHRVHYSYCMKKTKRKKKSKTIRMQMKKEHSKLRINSTEIGAHFFFLYLIMTRNMTALKTNKPAISSDGITISNNVSVSAIFFAQQISIYSYYSVDPHKTLWKLEQNGKY